MFVKRLFSTQAGYAISREALKAQGITARNVLRNLSPAQIYEHGVNRMPGNPGTPQSVVSSTGALCAFSGERTGRTPKDKRVVQDEMTSKDVWWGKVNIPITREKFTELEDRALSYLNNKDRLYIVDGYVGYDPKYRRKVRIYCTRAYHALFMNNMLIRPTPEQLKNDFAEVDFTIYNAGEFYAPPGTTSGNSRTCAAFDFTQGKGVILGTQYAGEMKKGLFSLMNYLMPKEGCPSLHASCNEGEDGDVTLLFGLSGTGKTTLSADPKRKLIGDDEHVWSADGVFNIEGGCYAKCIDLTREKEPEIWDAIKFGAVLENVGFSDPVNRVVDYTDVKITENTRVSYPIEYMANCKVPGMGGHPKNVIFLTCDAFGVFPPVCKLTPEQASYHYISGYTAKVAGTEVGIVDPQTTFSACFGEAFLPLHPAKYATLLAQKIEEHGSNVWLINTGWVGGKYGVGSRISLKNTRAIIDAIHDGSLAKEEYENFPTFDLALPKNVNNCDPSILNPRNAWKDKADYDQSLKKLAGLFVKNFENYKKDSSAAIINAGPKL